MKAVAWTDTVRFIVYYRRLYSSLFVKNDLFFIWELFKYACYFRKQSNVFDKSLYGEAATPEIPIVVSLLICIFKQLEVQFFFVRRPTFPPLVLGIAFEEIKVFLFRPDNS